MIDLLFSLTDDLATYVENADCEVSRVTATFGDPPDPTGTNCKTIFTWLAQVSPRETADPNTCVTLTRLTFAIRILSCYPIQSADLTDDQYLEATDCLVELVNAVWCGLVRDKDTGALMGLGTCEGITLLPLVADPSRGGIASYTGGVIVDYTCPIS